MSEADEFLKKTSAIEETIKGLANGTLDPDKVSLRQYGIFTAEEKAEEESRKFKLKKEYEEKQKSKKQSERESERIKWWEGAKYLIHSDQESSEEQRSSEEQKVFRKQSTKNFCNLYSSDYSRWSDDGYVPDDEATKEELLENRKREEEKRNQTFEKANKEWCATMNADIRRRKESKEKDKSCAIKLRLKGNVLMKKKRYEDAIDNYCQALQKAPYEVNVLMNLAITFGKTKCWNDCIEFCDRVLYLDKLHVKALFHKYKAHMAQCNWDEAFTQISQCVCIDSQNLEFQKCRKELSQAIENHNIEKKLTEVKSLRHKANNDNSQDTGTPCDVSSEELKLVVRPIQNDMDCTSLIIEQCRIIDQCVMKLLTFGFIQMISNESLSQLLCLKIRSCSVTATYLRKSGHLKDIIESFLKYCKKFQVLSQSSSTQVQDMNTIYNIEESANILAEIMRKDKFSCALLEENNVFSTAIPYLLMDCDVEVNTSHQVNCVSSIYHLIARYIESKDNFIKKDQVMSFLNTSFFQRYSKNVHDWTVVLNKNSRPHLLEAISKATNMISCIANNNTLRTKLCTCKKERPIVSCLALALKVSPSLTVKDKKRLTDMRRSVICAMQSLSEMKEIQSFFLEDIEIISAKGSRSIYISSIPILLAVSRSFTSESDVTRESALAILVNLLTKVENKTNCSSTINEIIKYDGIQALIGICSNNKTHPRISVQGLVLIDRILLSKQGVELRKDQMDMIWTQFEKLVLDEQWKIVSDLSEYNGIAATILIRIIAVTKAKVTKDLIRVLPKPRRDVNGNTSAQSICQPPEQLIDGTAAAIAGSSPSFYCNVLKVFIIHLDTYSDNHDGILNEDGIEYLICFLANHSKYHKSATKNAATALAKLVQKNEKLRNRVRDLRGIEILMKLNQSTEI